MLNSAVGNEANLSSTSDGNLSALQSSSGGAIPATIGFDKGKWYWEVEIDTQKDYTQLAGIINESHLLSGNVGATSTSWGYFQGNTLDNEGLHNNGWTVLSNGINRIFYKWLIMIIVKLGVNGTYVNSGIELTGTGG